jgi:hypothetical protein
MARFREAKILATQFFKPTTGAHFLKKSCQFCGVRCETTWMARRRA